MSEKKIGFVVPYFGNLPDYFQVWLDSCKDNPTIDWLLFTNDKSQYEYPSNVKVQYTTFEDIQVLIKRNYEFDVKIESPYKLCDYKIAYGEIFKEYLVNYDFWGYCDVDLIWGDIRKFYTNELLDEYDKIGNQGHATIYRNDIEVNARYKFKIDDESYIDDFMTNDICCTDVKLIRKIYENYKFKSYDEAIYAGLEKYEPAFYLQAKPKTEAWKNKHQIFLLEKGKLIRYYTNERNELFQEEYLYIHFFCRPMKNLITSMERVLIYPDIYRTFTETITPKLVKKYGKKSKISYYYRVFLQNRHRISIKKIISYFEIKKKYVNTKR